MEQHGRRGPDKKGGKIMAEATATRNRRPSRRALDDLEEEDRKLYESIPAKLDYVFHPSFNLPATEQRFFGPQAETIRVLPWRQYPALEDPVRSAPGRRTQLSRTQEAGLFLRYNYARFRLAELVASQQRRLASRRIPAILLWYRRVLASRSALANANMALVVAMAKRTRIQSIEFGELVSEGNMALLRAVDKFDVARGFKFSTYACRAILKAFNRLATKTGNYRQHFPTEYDPAMEQSDELDRRHKDQRELAIEDLQRVLLRNAAELTEVERKVVGARFAVSGYRQALTLEEVGRVVGLSKERVRQVQNEALAKLRTALDEVAA